MITNTQEQVLQLLLSRPREKISIRGIARLLGKSYTLTYNNIQALVKRNFLEALSVPPAQIIHLKEGIQTKKSDLDLLIIVPKKEDIRELEKAAQQYTQVKKGIIVADAQSFGEMIKNSKGLSVGIEAQKHHVILYGAEQYYRLLKT